VKKLFLSIGGGHLLAAAEGSASKQAMMTRSERMPPHSKQVLDRGVDTEESLSLPGGCKPTHPPFPLPGPLVGNLGSVVLVPTRLVRNGREQFSMSSAVASRFVGDESVWNRALPLREATKEPLRCCRVSPFRHQNVECVAVLIDRTPKVERFSLNLHEEFVDVPDIAHPTLPFSDRPGVSRPKLHTPEPDCLVGDEYPALGKKVLDIS
jgi:hypothetical protein